MTDTIRERLLKIKSLAERGSEHEAILAKEKFIELLEKYGLTEEDLSINNITTYKYKYRSLWHKNLMCQIKVMITNSNSFFNYEKGSGKVKGVIGFDFTIAQQKEFEWLWKHYKAEYVKELDLLFKAFIHKHHLFSSNSKGSSKDIGSDEMEALFCMISGLSSKTINREIKQIT